MAQSSEDRLKKIIADQLSVNEDDVVPEASFIDDLNADSLDLVELIMSLEEEFGVKISDEDAAKIQTCRTRWTICRSTPTGRDPRSAQRATWHPHRGLMTWTDRDDPHDRSPRRAEHCSQAQTAR